VAWADGPFTAGAAVHSLLRYGHVYPLIRPGEAIPGFIRDRGFVFPSWLVTDYLISLASKPFVIISGISGTGKTKMTQLVADYMSKVSGVDESTAFVPVRPDWTDNSHLLGWYNAIAERYETTPVLDLIIKASDAPAAPHFIILDEMNIAKVEHYFSDFLGCMESRWIDVDDRVRQEPIHLHSHVADYEAGEGSVSIPPWLDLPLNVYVVGTVNVDESTYMFSPKVLDRANVIEFNDVCLDPDSQMRESTLADPKTPGSSGFVLRSDVNPVELLSGYTPAPPKLWIRMKDEMPEHFELLLEVHEALRPYYLHFGYRVANEIAAFMLNTRKYCADGDDALSSTFDLQVLQKILPKMHGAVNSVAWRRAWSRWGSRPSLSRQAWRAEMLRWRAGR
jgi:5-methylcytosine-specific restriction endonuclease McrBC GTP-binding regulatory subunit McrB